MKQIQVGDRVLSFVGVSETDPYLGRLTFDAEHSFDELCGFLLQDPAGIALDVGANIGVTASFLSRHLPRGKVFAFEPGSSVYATLLKNLQANGLSNVHPSNCAVNHQSGTVRFSEFFAFGHITTRPDAPITRAISIDDFVNEHALPRVDLIKIDVEGFEKDVLLGAEQTIDRLSPVVHMEFNCWCHVSHSNINSIEFAEWLLQRFRFAFVIDRNSPRLHLTRIPPDGARTFVHEHMVPGVCLDDLVVTNSEQHVERIEYANQNSKHSGGRFFRGPHFALRPALASLGRLLKKQLLNRDAA